jgi:hypothetical protein
MGRTRATGFVVCPREANCRKDSLFIGNRRREGKSSRQEMKRLAAGRGGKPSRRNSRNELAPGDEEAGGWERGEAFQVKLP